ncbi:MAG: ABC transporter ATP-binding protein [Methanomicrobiales archaeon]|nr:ABC transporter ATP-binding protein [Methanomicrobiales archaeon]
MIELDRVSLTLGSFLLNDISLTIDQGDYYFIVGPSGAGKTVILEAIAGLHRPDRGRILLRGEEVTALPPGKRGVALVYQDYSLFPHMSVIDNISYGLRVRGMGRPAARREVAGLLDEFGIVHLADRYPGTLSGGEQQRVALARAVAVKPDVLLLDEPLSALDPVTQEKFILDLQRLHREDGLTIVQVSHSRRETRLLATRMAVLIDGNLADGGEADVVLNTPRSREVASFIGIENILDGTVVKNEGGRAVVDLGGPVLEAATDAPVGEAVTLCIRSDDITLGAAHGVRNSMGGTVARVVESGPIAEVKVDCGVELTAAMTRRAVRSLRIVPGTPVTLSIEDGAIHVIRRPTRALPLSR